MAYKQTSPLIIAEGGTNATSLTDTDGIIYFDGTSLVTTDPGTSGYVLTSSGGSGVPPSFQPGGSGGSSTIFIGVLEADDDDVTGDGTVYNIYGLTPYVDSASAYDTSTGTYTIPEDGNYNIITQVTMHGIFGSMVKAQTFITISGDSNFEDAFATFPVVTAAGSTLSFPLSFIANLLAGDTINWSIAISGGTLDADISGLEGEFATYFTLYKLQ